MVGWPHSVLVGLYGDYGHSGLHGRYGVYGLTGLYGVWSIWSLWTQARRTTYELSICENMCTSVRTPCTTRP